MGKKRMKSREHKAEFQKGVSGRTFAIYNVYERKLKQGAKCNALQGEWISVHLTKLSLINSKGRSSEREEDKTQKQ